MTSVNLLIVLIVGALVGTLTGLALGGLVDDLYLAMIAGILATITAGIVRNTIMTRVVLEPELDGMPLERMPQPQLLTIYSAVAVDRIRFQDHVMRGPRDRQAVHPARQAFDAETTQGEVARGIRSAIIAPGAEADADEATPVDGSHARTADHA